MLHMCKTIEFWRTELSTAWILQFLPRPIQGKAKCVHPLLKRRITFTTVKGDLAIHLPMSKEHTWIGFD